MLCKKKNLSDDPFTVAAELRDVMGGLRQRSGRRSHWSEGSEGGGAKHKKVGGARTRGKKARPRPGLTLCMKTCGQKRGSGAEAGGGSIPDPVRHATVWPCV